MSITNIMTRSKLKGYKITKIRFTLYLERQRAMKAAQFYIDDELEEVFLNMNPTILPHHERTLDQTLSGTGQKVPGLCSLPGRNPYH